MTMVDELDARELRRIRGRRHLRYLRRLAAHRSRSRLEASGEPAVAPSVTGGAGEISASSEEGGADLQPSSGTQRGERLRRATTLVTGFPGFLASRLLEELLDEQPEATFVFLVESRFRRRAERRLEAISSRREIDAGRFEVVEGDITRPDLGLGEATYRELVGRVGVVWHLAAIYDLAVEESLAYRVNVTGTVHVLDFCEACDDFQRLNYVSTCYVSGEREGWIEEEELDEGQSHKNHYEATKFWAEIEVRRRLDVVPAAILRPGIVVGDSRTGETDKYDGPYYLFELIERLPRWVPLVNIGKGDCVVNIVPVDFVVAAMAHIGLAAQTAGRTYQLADPNPMRARDILALSIDLLGHRRLSGVSLPPWLVEGALEYEAVEELVGMPQESVIYFNHDARYDSTHTQRALAETSIRCPHLSSYLSTLIEYFLEHPDPAPFGRES
jgi:thioester reductase-like protein